jgi:tetratricopeptide (TPR) repeat protein
MKRQVFGESHEAVAQALNDYAATLDRQGDLDAATGIYQQALTAYRSLLGPEHLAVSIVAANVGRALRLTGSLDEAEALDREALEIADANLGEENRYSARARVELGAVLHARGDLAAAEQQYRRAVAINNANAIQRSIAALELGRLLVDTDRVEEAASLLTEAHQVFQDAVGDEHLKTGRTKAWLAAALAGLGRHAEAERLLDEALAVQRSQLPADHPHLLESEETVSAMVSPSGG